MIFFAASGCLQQTLLALVLFGVALLQLLLVIEDVAERRYLCALFDCVIMAGELLFAGILYAVMDGVWNLAMCVAVLWIVEIGLLAYAVVRYVCTRRRMRYSLSRESIKEGSDNLPDGICFFDRQGSVQLINRKMMAIGIMLFGREIQTLDELRGALLCPPRAVKCLDSAILLYQFPDGTVQRFTESVIAGRDGEQITEVIAADVTELYAKQEELNIENARLTDANKRMKWILDNMNDIVREEEILSMKIRVHDDIGHSILAAKKALIEPQDIALIRENAARWENAVDMLYRANNMPAVQDEWETVQSRAQDLGVRIVLDGALPVDVSARYLLLLAVRECVTNCVRHAGGSSVFLKVSCGEEQTECEITNNGRLPSQPVVEGGGLSGLRRRIEREGGIMELMSVPRFVLRIVLPAKEEFV